MASEVSTDRAAPGSSDMVRERLRRQPTDQAPDPASKGRAVQRHRADEADEGTEQRVHETRLDQAGARTLVKPRCLGEQDGQRRDED
jgi:hypothetical protein